MILQKRTWRHECSIYKQIRPFTGSGALARNILIIETQINFKWQMWCN